MSKYTLKFYFEIKVLYLKFYISAHGKEQSVVAIVETYI